MPVGLQLDEAGLRFHGQHLTQRPIHELLVPGIGLPGQAESFVPPAAGQQDDHEHRAQQQAPGPAPSVRTAHLGPPPAGSSARLGSPALKAYFWLA